MVHRRRFAWLLMLALLVPILVACGGGGGTTTASTPAAGSEPAEASVGTEASAPAEESAEPEASMEASMEASAEASMEASMEASAEGEASGAASAEGEASEAASAEGEASEAASADAEASEAAGSSAASADIPVPEVAGIRTDLTGQSLQWVASADGPGAPVDDEVAAAFTEQTGIEVEVIRGDESATNRLSTYLQQLNAGAGPDVLQIDVIWPGIMADYAADLSDSIPDIDQYFPAIVENNTVDGKLVGVPWFTDAGLLYYRTDLLEKYGFDGPPETWAELEEQARTIQEGERGEGKADFWGYVWQGNAYEGLTCNALEWQVSNGGGQIVEGSPDAPEVTINNPQAIAAFERAAGWVGTISPDGVTTYDEPTSLGVWQAGNAAFMRNWPYAIAETRGADFADSFDVTVLPRGDGDGARNADTLGGWQLMVNDASENKDAAVELVKFITSPEMQEFYAIRRTLLPTRPAVYEDADVLNVNPYYESLLPVFSGGAVPRPSTVTSDLYNDVSTAYFTAVNQILTGQVEAAEGVQQLEEELNSILQ